MTYPEKLKDPRWQKKRLQVLELAMWRCEDCSRADKQLDVHHCAYISGIEPWQYDFSLLMALCRPCHDFRQLRENSLRVDLGKITRHLAPQQLESEAWRLVQEMSTRETERLAEAFTA